MDSIDLALPRPVSATAVRGFVFADLRAHGRGRPMPNDAGVELRERFRGTVSAAARRHGALDMTAVGDGYYVVLPNPRAALRCARAIVTAADQPTEGREPLRVAVGVHAAPADLIARPPLDGPGHLAARIGAVAPTGVVLVTQEVVDQVGHSGLRFEPRVLPPLKGIRAVPTVFAATGDGPSSGSGRVARLLAMGSLAGLLSLAAVVGLAGQPIGPMDGPLVDGGGAATTLGPDVIGPGVDGELGGAAGTTGVDDGEDGLVPSAKPTDPPPPLRAPLQLTLRFR